MRSWLQRNVSAQALFLAGGGLAASFAAQASLTQRSIQCVELIVLALLVGRRVRWARTLLFGATIVLFNVLTPAGQVLARIGGLAITDGALRAGATKAVSLSGLLLLSKIIVRRDLRLPGGAGALLGQCLAYFGRLAEARTQLDPRAPLRSLDALIREVAPSRDERIPVVTPTSPQGWVVLILLVAANWVLVFSTLWVGFSGI